MKIERYFKPRWMGHARISKTWMGHSRYNDVPLETQSGNPMQEISNLEHAELMSSRCAMMQTLASDPALY